MQFDFIKQQKHKNNIKMDGVNERKANNANRTCTCHAVVASRLLGLQSFWPRLPCPAALRQPATKADHTVALLEP